MEPSALRAMARLRFDRLWRSATSKLRLPLLVVCLVLVLVHKDSTSSQSFLVRQGCIGTSWRSSRPQRQVAAAGVSEDVSDRLMREEARNFRMNLGHALDVLRRDVPHMFDKSYDLDYSIFSPSVVAEDARMPNVQMRGLEAYRTTIDLIRQVVRTTCDHHKMEIQSISVPVNSVVYVRWRLQIWPKDPLGPAKVFLNPAWRLFSSPLHDYGAAVEPTILEGYSKYDFDAWSGEIVKHAVEVTLPPMLLKDFVQQPSFAFLFLSAPGSGGYVPATPPRPRVTF
ncbi:unnamed protein product [Symbiodinium natans]|uniref:Uncharacterized protein n=1 Tax=Symbiodinium natans TaxID=878477 RepID=A0A812SQ80_9DINO|nr:unnamed protein product [Symbiodinium natans]